MIDEAGERAKKMKPRGFRQKLLLVVQKGPTEVRQAALFTVLLSFLTKKIRRYPQRSTLCIFLFAALSFLFLSRLPKSLHNYSDAMMESRIRPTKKELCDNSGKIWDGMARSAGRQSRNSPGKAALYTPYNIVPGGGERYLLSAAAVFQKMNYHVALLTTLQNVCKTKRMLLNVADALNVPLSPSRLSYDRVSHITAYTKKLAYQYDVFFLLGNEKFPRIPGVGAVNLYMCQFPFDLQRAMTKQELHAFTTYDSVIVNSKYTYRHYNLYAQPAFWQARKKNLLTPLVSLLSPPVTDTATIVQKPVQFERKGIVMIGRIFKGRQNKGYLSALYMLHELSKCVQGGVELQIVGSLMPGHAEHYRELQALIAKLGLKAKIHIDAPPNELADVLATSLVQWHLTGVDAPTEDPASEEHFGVSVVEGMQAGVIPVVINKGGLTEIVQNGSSGFVGTTKTEIVGLTCRLFHMRTDRLLHIGKEARKVAETFAFTNFQTSLSVIVKRAFLSKPFRHLIMRTSHIVHEGKYHQPANSTKLALIIEDRQHFAFEYVVKNALYHLGKDWGLVVLHTNTNDKYVHHALSTIKNANFQHLDVDFFSIDMLNRYMKSKRFWSFNAEKILVFQTDSLFIHGNISKFIKYDFIGAPWHLRNERWSKMYDIIPTGVGNGGLSLRSTAAMREIAGRYSQYSPLSENEDMFFVTHMQNASSYKLPSRRTAYQFAREVPCADIDRKIDDEMKEGLSAKRKGPMALHATWYYMSSKYYRSKLLRYLELSLCSSRH
mmetsp:Transcript_8540/g.53373  ORF Transcript_8540/g.53373 Transcript_8540/m.53373 type:complete len:775 (+) Transcript_8540:380-2704(+)